MNREYPKHPMVGVAAVVFEGASVWLARRGREPGMGLWSLPGGLVELGESHLDALERELREELCIGIEVGGLVGVFDKIFRDPRDRIQYHYVVVDYWGWITEGRPTPASDITEAVRIPLASLDEVDADKDLVRAVRIAEKAWSKQMASRRGAEAQRKDIFS